MPGCFVKGCQSGRRKATNDLKLHCFPRKTESIRRWLLELGHQPEIVDVMAGVIYSNQTSAYRICSKHFSPAAYEQRGSHFYLKTDAFPTLYLDDETTPDHSYSKKRRIDDQSEEISGTSESILSLDSLRKHSLDSSTQCIQLQFTDGTCLDPLDVQSFEAVETTEMMADEISLDIQSACCNVNRKISDRATCSVLTSTDSSVGKIPKHTQFDKRFGTKNKSVQVKTRQAHRSTSVQCNLAQLPSLSECNKFLVSQKKIHKGTQTSQNYPLKDFDPSTCEQPVSGKFDPLSRLFCVLPNNEIDLQAPDLSYIPNLYDQKREAVRSQSDSEHINTVNKYQLNDSYRPTVKEEEVFNQEMEVDEEIYIDPSDMDSSFVLLPEDKPKNNFVNENKYIVFDSCLHKLLMSCKCQSSPSCHGNIIRIKKYRIGSAISVTGYCSENHKFNLWRSQPLIGRKPIGNVLISAAIVCSGSNFLKIENFFSTLNVFGISKSTYYNSQHNYIFPTVDHFWQVNRRESLDLLQNEPVALAGDGQFDSPRHSAKYCIYNFMDFKSKRIIDFQVEQVQTGINAVALKRQAFQNGLDRLLEDGLNVYVLCTDRHASLKKLIQDKYSFIVHQFNLWHIAKSVGNKMLAASRRASCGKLAKWVVQTKNHLWWSVSSCLHNPALLVEQWSSIVYHVSNHHHWENGHLYKECHHGPIREDEQKQHEWLAVGSPAHSAFKDIVLNKKLLKDIEQLAFFCHTGDLEIFHSTALKYSAKRNHYFIDGMVARMQLAALDHNYNLNRAQVVVKNTSVSESEDRTPRHWYTFSKAQKTWVVSGMYEATSQDFIKNIMFEILELAAGQRNFTWKSRRDEVPEHSAQFQRPDKT